MNRNRDELEVPSQMGSGRVSPVGTRDSTQCEDVNPRISGQGLGLMSQ